MKIKLVFSIFLISITDLYYYLNGYEIRYIIIKNINIKLFQFFILSI